MATLQQRLKELEKASHNVDGADGVRKLIVEEFSDDPQAADAVAEALYRLGLTTLLHRKDLNAAMELFKKAADRKHPLWSPFARTSHAITLHAKGKAQQALFELKKVTAARPVSPAVGTAYAMLCTMLRDQGAKPSEIAKADQERLNVLKELMDGSAANPEENAHWRLLLAIAHKEGGSRSECKALLESVVALGKAAGADTLSQAQDFLRGM